MEDHPRSKRHGVITNSFIRDPSLFLCPGGDLCILFNPFRVEFIMGVGHVNVFL